MIEDLSRIGEIKAKVHAVKELTNLFRFERAVYLGATVTSLVMIMGSAISYMLKEQGGVAELSLLFGSTGLITCTAGGALYMWNAALKLLFPSDANEKS